MNFHKYFPSSVRFFRVNRQYPSFPGDCGIREQTHGICESLLRFAWQVYSISLLIQTKTSSFRPFVVALEDTASYTAEFILATIEPDDEESMAGRLSGRANSQAKTSSQQ